MSEKRCENCEHFMRAKWHKAVTQSGSEEDQEGGYCAAIANLLKATNAFMVWHDVVYVYDRFCCAAYRGK